MEEKKTLRTPRPATEPRNGPTRNFHERYRKNTPRPEILEPQENTPKIPRKYRKNTPKIPKMHIFGIFSVFLGYFLGVPELRPGGYFFGIFRGNSGVGPFRGSVAGRGVLKENANLWGGGVFLVSKLFLLSTFCLFCLSFSSLPLLFDILKRLKKVPTRWGLWQIP